MRERSALINVVLFFLSLIVASASSAFTPPHAVHRTPPPQTIPFPQAVLCRLALSVITLCSYWPVVHRVLGAVDGSIRGSHANSSSTAEIGEVEGACGLLPRLRRKCSFSLGVCRCPPPPPCLPAVTLPSASLLFLGVPSLSPLSPPSISPPLSLVCICRCFVFLCPPSSTFPCSVSWDSNRGPNPKTCGGRSPYAPNHPPRGYKPLWK